MLLIGNKHDSFVTYVYILLSVDAAALMFALRIGFKPMRCRGYLSGVNDLAAIFVNSSTNGPFRHLSC